MREEDLWDMSDEDLEAAFKEAQASENSPEIDDQLEDDSEPSTEEPEFESEEEITSETEEDDGPEQPEEDLEDSDDHDASDESDAEPTDAEDESKADEESTDEDSESEEDPSSEDEDKEEEEEQPAQTYKFKANGKDYEFSSQEMVDQFPRIFGQAMDYTKKMQAIKPWRKTIDAIEGAELSHEDINLMIDVLKGDKTAITEVLKRTGTDTLDLNTEEDSKYVAKDYGRDDSALAIKDIIEDISQDVEYTTTQHILAKEWDQKSWDTMAQNPEMIRLLHTDVKNGMYKTLQPMAEKLKVYDGGKQSDLDYYKAAAQQHFTQVAQQEAYEKQKAEKQAKQEAQQAERDRLAQVKAQTQQRTATKQASVKRKAAAPTKSAAQSRDVIDYLDDSDEAFDEWYKKLQDSM